ncbi:methionine adenosyltransferase [Candidatus Bathyarchaeota archaeon]|nr:MAG: methionine adenosyltransferase [Candidatus Bathyarchaeota archaeon]RJS81449.1 MAG: methionine adenosyltransferase [Candidatus Bathyarchaeota archaeon]RLI18675.1 MAG: methionine adenosyltransferase [Candidatus Bathyarchaeota archaeon]
MRNIIVEDLKQVPLEKQRIEIVERKGLGHPDYICDAVMDSISIRLSKEYLEKAGSILHHNVDKSLLVAGEAEPRFGGGIIKQPMLFVFGDRATSEFNGTKIDVEQIAITTAKEWFKKNMRFVDPEKHVKYQVELKPGSAGLVDIFKRKGKVLGANDTSAAVGYAPMTRTEKIVLKTEQFLNSKEFKNRFPESGEDIKVMGFRSNNTLNLTISMAFVDQFISSEEEYFEKKAKILEEIEKFVNVDMDFEKVNVQLNTLDVRGRGIGGLYLTVLGTSADSGDSGQVGRGNRVNGLISLNRPFCSEAAAGKNPVSHVGKIYNVLTFRIAQHVYDEVPEVEEVYVWLLSKIGSPIDQPAVAAAQVVMKGNNSLEKVRSEIGEVLDYELENIDKFCIELAQGKIQTY